MAERRMFTKKITDSDAFLDMPLSTQCLYFHLNMNADDDGFVNNPKKICRLVNASIDDYKMLVAKNFVIPFDSGVVVIKHWRLHNYIQSDRYKPTVYTEEKSMLSVKENKAYTINGYSLDTECIQNGSVGKDSIDKVSIGKVNNYIYNARACERETDFDFENAFMKTFEHYPKQNDMATGKAIWLKFVCEVAEEERIAYTKDLYRAITMYIEDYKLRKPDDTKFDFVPKFYKWLEEDSDYWLHKLYEKRKANEQSSN